MGNREDVVKHYSLIHVAYNLVHDFKPDDLCVDEKGVAYYIYYDKKRAEELHEQYRNDKFINSFHNHLRDIKRQVKAAVQQNRRVTTETSD